MNENFLTTWEILNKIFLSQSLNVEFKREDEILNTIYDPISNALKITITNINDILSGSVSGSLPSLPLNSIQFNNNNLFGGSEDLMWDRTNSILKLKTTTDNGTTNIIEGFNHSNNKMFYVNSLGYISGSNLKGNNTGDQDLSGLLPNSHLTDFTHSNIAHTNRTALDLVTGSNTGDQYILPFEGNGIISGMSLEIESDNTKFKINSGSYHTVNNDIVTFNIVNNITVTNLSTHLVTYIAINIDTNLIIQKTTLFTNSERRNHLLLGVIVHSNKLNINAINNLPDIAINSLSQFNDLLDSFKIFNKEGNVFSANGINLKLNKSVGRIFKRGVNFHTDISNPHCKLLDALIAPTNIRHRLSDGTEYGDTDVLSLYYESSVGVRTAIPNTKFAIFRINIFPSNLIRIQYGRAIYNNISEAISGIFTEVFSVEQNIAENGLLRCLLIVKGNATDLSNLAVAKFIETDKYGQMPIGGTGGTTSLQGAYNNSVTPEIVTDGTLGAVSIKAGTTTKTNNILEIIDDEDAIVEKIDGNGFKSIRYRDEYVGGDWVLASGTAAPDVLSLTIGGVPTRMYGFDGTNTEERLSNTFEIPHDLAFDEINDGTLDIEAHVHWMPSTTNAGTVIWYFDYCYVPVHGASIPQTTLVATETILANQQYYQQITSFKDGNNVAKIPVPVGGFTLGDIILFNIRRTPTNAGDTYPADAIFIKAALHVPTNDFGSRQRYLK